MAASVRQNTVLPAKRLFVPFLLSLVLLASCSGQPAYPSAPVAGSEVIIDAASLAPDTPRFFTYHYRGKSVNFFVIRYRDRILTFLDACVTCYRSKQGYRFAEGSFICRDCGKAYALPEMETGFGGCFPVKVRGTLKDGKYRIPLSSLEKASSVF